MTGNFGRKPMLRIIYTLIFYLATPFILLRLLLRARKIPGYGQCWSERFGIIPALPTSTKTIWVHTVSVGESIAAAPLVRKLLAAQPDATILVTTMTATGSEQVQKLYGDELASGRILQCYIPYDLPCAVNRFLSRTRPQLAIFMETELWPNIIAACHQRNIPTLLTNARLSARSAKGYARIGLLTRPMLRKLSCIAAQTKGDAERFISLGFPKDRLQVTGTLKYDVTVPDITRVMAAALRKTWLAERSEGARILIAASTHTGEDEQILAAFRQLRHKLPSLLLILVPRHPERFDDVYGLITAEGWRCVRRSTGAPVTAETDVLLGDTMGELVRLYATADIAFVGGSLIERGGHNPLEPAALGLPVLAGPHVFNFTEVNHTLESAGALFTVENAEQLVQTSEQLLTDDQHWQQASQATQTVMAANRGAIDRQLQLAVLLLERH